VRIGGSAAFTAARHRVGRAVRTPWFGAAVLTPVLLVMAAGAGAPSHRNAMSDNGITPLAAVANTTDDDSGTTIVAATRPLPLFRISAPANISAPPPAVVVNSVGSLRIPMIALNAYQNAERMMAAAYPGCGISWNLLAGIGRIESMHANGGATDPHGTAINPIYGPTLDGTLAGNETIVQSVQAGRVTYARALGPMQFLPGTWARYASDGDGDGKADVQNVFDASLAAARYLCSGGLNLRNPSQILTAILRYNNSMAYAENVMGWAAAYATGVVPVDLPAISGPTALGDAHLDSNPEGLGPGLPLNAVGLPSNDPLAVLPLGPGRPDQAGQLMVPQQVPLPGPRAPVQNCAVFCLQGGPPTPAAPPPPAGQNCQVFCLQSTPVSQPEAPPPGQPFVQPPPPSGVDPNVPAAAPAAPAVPGPAPVAPGPVAPGASAPVPPA
jgi:membrane-bound lytic murein transglycosylase B